MSEMEQSNPLDNLDSEHLRALDEFDCIKSQFYDWLACEAAEPRGVTVENAELREYIDDVSTAFVELAVSCRAEAPNLDTAKAEIAELWRQDDQERVELFVSLADEGRFDSMSKEEFEQVVDSIFRDSDDDQDLVQNIREMYHGYISGDVMNFVGCIQSQGERGDSQTEEEVLLDIDLIDAAKRIGGFIIAVGFGMMIGKKFLK